MQRIGFEQTEIGEIPGGWRNYNLVDLIDIKHGFAFKGEFFSGDPTDDILLTPGNFNIGGGFKDGKFKYYRGDYPQDYVLKAGDIIVTMTDLSKNGDTLGYPAKVPNAKGKRYLHNQRLGLVIFKDKDIDRDFLYWLMRDKKYQQFVVNSASGSTVKHTSPNRIREFCFLAPQKINEQRAIAKILSDLDDKIEFNNRMNKTLESIAQAIFKRWFVDFEFPGYENTKIIDGLPEGWRQAELDDFVDFVVDNRGKTPTTIDEAENTYPLIEVNALINSPVVTQDHLAKKFVNEETYNTWFRNGHPKRGDVLFSTVGSIGEISIVFDERFCIAQNLIALRTNTRGIFLYFTLKSIKQNLIALDISSVQPSIKVPHLLKQKIMLPSDGLIHEFETSVCSLIDMVFNNEQESNHLAKIRDSLLPKLISGMIRVQN